MSFKDLFKNSVWNSFTASSGITADFVIQAVIAMVVAVILGILIYKIYGKFYGGVVYSNSFAVTLVGMTVLTCMLTLAISSNIVISLGMVGALSIVRYRTAIKDPMDLLFLFWSISVGITVAANLYILAAMTMIVMVFIIMFFYSKKKVGKIYIMVIHYSGYEAGDNITRLLTKHKYQIKSETIRKEIVELTIELNIKTGGNILLEQISGVEGVTDATMIQYNGEYNG